MNRGEIWLIDLEPTRGAEIKKIRPAVIVNDNRVGILPLKIIVPITDWKPHYTTVEWMVKLDPDIENGLNKLSAADAFQVRSVAKERFIRQLGKVSSTVLDEIADSLAIVLGI
jgi:mRNA interferase MazF